MLQTLRAIKRCSTGVAVALLAVSSVLFTTGHVSAYGTQLNVNERLHESGITSPNGQYQLIMQGDGNLVLYAGAYPYWASGTSDHNTTLVMQTDGNLVIYGDRGADWASGSSVPNFSGATLLLQNDGNLVVRRNMDGVVIWSPNAVPTKLPAGQLLRNNNWQIFSPNRRYRMVMQTDGNVVAYDGNTAIWSKHGSGKDATTLEMQTDSNLVMYTSRHVALWATGTRGDGGSYLQAQDDGNFVLYQPNGSSRAALWSTRGDTTPDVGGTVSGGGLLGGSDRDLAQKILNSGKVSGDSRYIGQIQAYANGNYGCHINPTILSLIYTAVAPTNIGGLNHTIQISSLNRFCTKVLTQSGTSSYHYRDGGGHAVDFSAVDGVGSTGSTAQDLVLLRQLAPRLPQGSAIGQVGCRTTTATKLVTPAGVSQIPDTCDHNHFQVPIR